MLQSRRSRLESVLRLSTGALLWAISTTLTVSLLVSLGDDSAFQRILLILVGPALEASKILSWRAGGMAKILPDEVWDSPAYGAKVSEVSSLDAEISVLISRIQSLPAD